MEPLPALPTNIKEIWQNLYIAAAKLSKAKQGSLVSNIQPNESYRGVLNVYQALIPDVEKYNAAIVAANVLIATAKEQAKNLDLATERRNLVRLQIEA